MATLQGLKLTEINLNINFLLALFLSLAFILIGKKFNHLIKVAILSLIFTFFYILINEGAPIWYNAGILLILSLIHI